MTDRPPATAAGGTLGSLEHAGAPIRRGIWAPLAWSRFTGVRATRRSRAGDTGCRSTTISDSRDAVPSAPAAGGTAPPRWSRRCRAAARAPSPRSARTGAARRSGLGHARLRRPGWPAPSAQAELLVGRQVVVAPPSTGTRSALCAGHRPGATPVRPDLAPRQREVLLAYVLSNAVHCAVGRSSGTDAETLKTHLWRVRARSTDADHPAPTRRHLNVRAVEDGLLPPPRSRG